MIPQRNGLSFQSPLNTLILLVLRLLLPQSCTGQSQLMGPSQPIVAAVGDDVVLPCYLEPAVDVAAMTLEWTRTDLKPIFVHVWRNRQDIVHAKNPSYKDRTSLSVDEMKRGNISLKLSDVKPSDQGTYQCYIPKLDKGSSVELVVGAVASAKVDFAGMDRNKGGVMLNCDSKGWYPEPEVLWLDGEGNLLSAGPPETVRGPDDLYTVSSRVTVEKRHSNRFTCRVQQENINQTREAHIHVPDDFFEVQSSSSSSSSVTGLVVGLAVCILIILLLVFFVWRQNKNKTNRCQVDEDKQKASRAEQDKLLEEKHEGQKEVVSLKNQLESKNKEVERLDAEVKRLTEEKKKSEDKLQKELEVQKQSADRKWNQTNEELKEANFQLRNKEREVGRLTAELKEEKKKSENLQTELNTKTYEVCNLNADVKRLKEEKKKSEDDLHKQLEDQKQSADRKWNQTNKELMEANVQVRNKERELDKPSSINSLQIRHGSLNTGKGQLLTLLQPHEERQHDGSSSAERLVIEVDRWGKFIRVRNTSCQDQRLGGWKLKLKINKDPFFFTFDPSFILEAGKFVTMWVQGYGSHYPPTDLVWRGLKTWSTKDHLQVDLLSDTREIKSTEFIFTGR